MEKKKNKNSSWFWGDGGQKLWQFALLKYVDYVNLFRHLGLSPAALCAATLWGGAMAMAVPPGQRHWEPATYFKIASALCVFSVLWNTGKSMWFSTDPSRTFWAGMAEFLGLVLVAGTRQPVSFLLAGNAAAWKSPVYPWLLGYFGIVVLLNLRRQWVRRQNELASHRARRIILDDPDKN